MRDNAAHNDSPLAPDDLSVMRPLCVWLVVAALAVAFVSLIVVAPLALAHGWWSTAFAIYQGFSFACHQIPARSFYLEGYPLAVCARCAGLYAGFAAGVIVYPLARDLKRTIAPSRVWLIAALLPLAVDWTLGFSGLWSNTHSSRFATGALLGAVSAFYVLPGLIDLSHRSWRGLLAQYFSSNESVSYER